MSVVKRTTVHSVFRAGVGIIHFEVDNDPLMTNVTVWFESWANQNYPSVCETYYGLTLEDKKPTIFSRQLARKIWDDLVERGFVIN
jgi:hypothetical protein